MSQYFPALVTLSSLFLFLATGIAVAVARRKYKIAAPATTGNTDFERVFRVQMNTQENLIIFLPALWLFSIYVSPLWAGVIGVVWLLGRIDYAVSYARSANARSRGFGIGSAAFFILAIGAAVKIVMNMFG